MVFSLLPMSQLPGYGQDRNETVSKPLSEKERQKRLKKLMKELETPYRKWLQEDVGYIITDEERAAFGRLATDDVLS